MRQNCPDCQAAIGELHHEGCDIERCPKCGVQRLSCNCARALTDDERMPWTGKWPGEAECEEYGWYCYWDSNGAGDPAQNYGWVRCGKDHPKAGCDLNRLFVECTWSPQLQKWVRVRKEN